MGLFKKLKEAFTNELGVTDTYKKHQELQPGDRVVLVEHIRHRTTLKEREDLFGRHGTVLEATERGSDILKFPVYKIRFDGYPNELWIDGMNFGKKTLQRE